MKLKLEHVKKSFDEKVVLKDINFTFEKGKIYGLLGRNGAGKTTLFNCINKEIKYDEGKIEIIKNNETSKINEDDVGFLYSTPILPEFLTGYEFIKFYMEINEMRIDKRKRIDDYFDLMQIEEEDRNRLIKEYSHGMKNKMQMLCFFISQPEIILLDEPLTSFDVIVALEMKNLLKAMKQDHIIVFSTHILQLAKDLCDDIVILHNGELEELDMSALNSDEFESKIVEILKDENHHD
ncbi:MAG: ABC transporter ATP-binding protein [Erysipelotrichaceae bacterium]